MIETCHCVEVGAQSQTQLRGTGRVTELSNAESQNGVQGNATDGCSISRGCRVHPSS